MLAFLAIQQKISYSSEKMQLAQIYFMQKVLSKNKDIKQWIFESTQEDVRTMLGRHRQILRIQDSVGELLSLEDGLTKQLYKLAVMQCKTKRGALVLDIADLITGTLMLLLAFICVKENLSEQNLGKNT